MTNIISTMLEQALAVMPRAYAPYSKFHVAACIRSDQDELFTGVNVENMSYGLTFCAEANAIGHLIAAGHRHIKDVVVVANSNELCAPCGACRQRLFEFSLPETQIYLCNDKGVLQSHLLDELLPVAFRFNP